MMIMVEEMMMNWKNEITQSEMAVCYLLDLLLYPILLLDVYHVSDRVDVNWK